MVPGSADYGVVEACGSIHHLQCLRPCSDDMWPADDIAIDVNEDVPPDAIR